MHFKNLKMKATAIIKDFAKQYIHRVASGVRSLGNSPPTRGETPQEADCQGTSPPTAAAPTAGCNRPQGWSSTQAFLRKVRTPLPLQAREQQDSRLETASPNRQ